jgi:hypothetical protein
VIRYRMTETELTVNTRNTEELPDHLLKEDTKRKQAETTQQKIKVIKLYLFIYKNIVLTL